jgi:heptosyltransferase-2
VLAPNWIGDVVMATPFLSILRKQNPDDFITILCRSYVSELLGRSSYHDTMIGYSRKSGVKGAILALRGQRPDRGWDAAFILPRSFSSALAAFMGGSRRRIGYRSAGRGWLLTDPLPADLHRKIHLSEEYAGLAAMYSGEPTDGIPEPCVVPPYDWKERIAKLGLEERYAVFATGARYGPAKIWPAERYTELALRLRDERGLLPVMAGSPYEHASIEKITSKTGGLNLAGKSSLGDLMSVMRGAEIVVGNDSGPVHVAAAMGLPTVAIFGSTSPRWTAPRGRYARVLTSGAQCAPCFKKECPEGDTHCLADIGAEEVFEAAVDILKESKE